MTKDPKKENFLAFFFDRNKYTDEKDYVRFIVSFTVAISAAIGHLFYFLFFLFIGNVPMMITHAVALVVFIVALVLVHNNRGNLACAMVSAMIAVTAIVCNVYVGSAHYSVLFLYLTLVISITFPYKKKLTRVILIVLSLACIAISHILSVFVPALTEIDELSLTILSIANLVTNALGIITCLLISNYANSFADSLKQDTLHELQEQAYYDSLTQLHNRRYADIYLSEICQEEAEVSFIAIADIDDFKLVNDTYGHEAGDVVLTTLADIFKNNIGANDVVFRWGGEEFVVIFRNSSRYEVKKCLEKIRKIISQTIIHVGDIQIKITITFGAASVDFEYFDKCFADADKNLYRGKHCGKNVTILK